MSDLPAVWAGPAAPAAGPAAPWLGEGEPASLAEPLLALNQALEQAAGQGRVEEARLDQWQGQLDTWPRPWPASLWITRARLLELALWWAGALADRGRFQAVGDLLFNPRRKLLYIKGRAQPLTLARHQTLTGQVAPLLAPGQDPIAWLKRNSQVHIARPPILPSLRDELAAWPGATPAYLAEVDQCLEQVAATLSYVAGLCLPPGRDLARHLALIPPAEAAAISENLCRFDLTRFNAWGRRLAETSL